jgi:uncharacterized membrane protein YoaK (UPF0700 family)
MAPRNTHWKPALALLLAAIAGFTDVVGYLTLHQVFTAHMTGNTSKLGIAIGTANVWAALPLAAAVALFAVGVGVGTLACDLGRRWQALLGQAILLAAFTARSPVTRSRASTCCSRSRRWPSASRPPR